MLLGPPWPHQISELQRAREMGRPRRSRRGAALTLSEGDPSILVSSITVFLWVVVALALLIPLVLPVAKRRKRAPAGVG
jgi:TctA family transporter